MPALLTVRTGDLLESSAQTLVNTVNIVGVMGKGIALEFKRRYPEMYADYVERCKRGAVRLGEPYLYRDLVRQWVLNFPTKEHWRSAANLASIEEGLGLLVEKYKDWGITSIAVPPLGCGLGGLDWEVVGPTLARYLAALEIPVELYAPYGTPQGQLSFEYLLAQAAPSEDLLSRGSNRIADGWIAIVAILDQVTRGKYHWPVGRVTFEKIAYFATQAGIDTGLEFARGSFGPHSAEYEGMRKRLEMNGLLTESILGKMHEQRPGPTYRPELLPAFRAQQWRIAIEKVTDLFMRIQSTKQAELAASAHFAAQLLRSESGQRPTELAVFEYVKQWKARRREGPYPDADIADAIRGLAVLGWLDVRGSRDLPLAA